MELKDEFFMKLAIKEAKKGLGKVSPNPVVGAVIVDPKTGEIIAKGYHGFYGGPHAEAVAIEKAGSQAKNKVLYVTLEPCCHYGKTPPCTEKIIKAGIKKVICGIRDPNPVARGGLEVLKKHGIEVKCGILEEEVKYLTRFFLSGILRKRPWIIMKVAASLDGKIAVSTGDSKWITSVEARKKGHYLRSICDGIVVGKNTVLKDNPELTCRLVKGKNPIRFVLDTNLSLSPNYKVFNPSAPTILVCGKEAPKEKEIEFERLGVEVWRLPVKRGKVDLKTFCKMCYERGINSLLVEGGGQVHGSFIEENLVDEVFYFLGPLIIGDEKGIPAVKRRPLKALKDALFLKRVKSKKYGNSYLIHGITEEGTCLLSTPLK